MILADFIVQRPVGLYCVYGDFYLDPKVPVQKAVISHAHADHAIGGHAQVYCTKSTALFMKHRYRDNAGESFFLKDFHESFIINEVTITFIPAGHMLGSAQVMMTYKGIKYLYTGDFKLQADTTCEPFEFVKADVLLTETTFANPDTQHPSPEAELLKLNATTSNIMLGAYVLGKSQRLIHLLQQHCPEKRILIHHSILPFLRIYEQAGISFGKYELFDKRVLKSNQQIVYLVPPMVYNSNIKTMNVMKVFATGWKDLQRSNKIQLYVSDHADWNDILLTITNVQPTQVWTTHGSGVALKNYYGERLEVKILN
ncbi:MBL fold metallo-hydrolase [Pedobacter sp.]|uniref:MBL fold metallo-hydrolase n=1 Tax=Pedobacter sp. TaxID=1411316 RepID=UPI003D7FCEF2